MKTRKGYLVKRGQTFYAVWQIAGRKYMKTTRQTTEREAKKELARIMEPYLVEDTIRTLESVKARIESGKAELVTLNEERNPPLAVAGAWTEYLASQRRPDTGKATLAVYELTWGRFQTWLKDNHPDAKTMRDVTPEIASQFTAWLTSEGRSPNTFNKYKNICGMVYRVLKDKARWTVNPFEGIQRKHEIIHGRRELTIEELRKVSAAAAGDLRLLLALGIYTGLRLGDCCTLRWADVDLARGRIVRIPNKTGRSNPKPVLVPLYPALADLLAEIPTAKHTGYVMPKIATDYLRHPSNVTNRVQALFKSCGIQTTRTIDGQTLSQVEVGFHSFRHSFVSLCRESGAPLSVVESIVGHSNPAMTRHYTHTSEAAAIAAVSSLPSMQAVDTKALPPAQSPHLVDAGSIRERLQAMTAKTWKSIRDEMLTMVSKQ